MYSFFCYSLYITLLLKSLSKVMKYVSTTYPLSKKAAAAISWPNFFVSFSLKLKEKSWNNAAAYHFSHFSLRHPNKNVQWHHEDGWRCSDHLDDQSASLRCHCWSVRNWFKYWQHEKKKGRKWRRGERETMINKSQSWVVKFHHCT